MTAYDQYVTLLTKYSEENEKEIKTFLTIHNKLKPKTSALDYIPEQYHRNKKNDPSEQPVFIAFKSLFMDTFFTPYIGEIIADLNHHHPEVHGKTLEQINKIKDLWNRPYLSTNYILDELSFILTIDLISQTMFKGKDNELESGINMGFSAIRQYTPDVLTFDDAFPCSYCNAHAKAIYNFKLRKFVLPDYIVKQNPEPCIHSSKDKKKLFNYDFTLECKSKKLVFLNDIRQAFNVKRHDSITVSLNSDLGKKRECEAYVEHNIAYFFVGNTSPNIYQHKTKNEIIIDPENVKLKWDENKDTIKKESEYHDRGNICTDLWAVFMLDYDDFINHCSEKGINPKELDPIIVNVDSEDIKVKYNFKKDLVQITY